MREINPKETTRAYAFELWMKAPMPMVTFFKTLDVSRLVKISKKSGMKFNMLMCWCIGKAASGIKEFYMLPVGDKLMQYDEIDGAVGMYSGIFNNPFIIWGKYRKGFFRTTLTVSFQFHHTQMDGAHAAKFLDRLQQEINKLLV